MSSSGEMLTTNKIKLPEATPPQKVKVLTTSNTKPREMALADPDKFQGVNRRETKKVAGGMLTTANYVERAEKERRKAAPPVAKKARRTRKKK